MTVELCAAPEDRTSSEVADIANRLIAQLSPAVPADVVLIAVHDAAVSLDAARVPQYVPLLVERLARQELARWSAAEAAVIGP